MVNACNALNVGIYVDAVINHMADIEVPVGAGVGTAGTSYQSTPAGSRTYGAQYQADDFHSPDCTISDYGDRRQVQQCKLSGLPDLHTGKADVQTELHDYLQALIDAGVKGFRIDGAKHMAAHDIEAIFDGLTGSFYVFQEVIDQSADERVRDWEYTPSGDVTEFAYAFALGAAFDDACSGSLSDLEGRFDDADMLPSRFAQVFSDNHDNQRGHGVGSGCVVDHRDDQEHVLANIFALAYPYGHPSVMSSYYWQESSTINTNDSYGPPTVTGGPGSDGATLPVYVDGDNIPDNCAATYTWGKWTCEHRRTATANMVKFRQVTAGETVTWQNIGATPTDHIALRLGSKGFVAINRTSSPATTTYQTGLPAGSYCDITKYDFNPNTNQCVAPGTRMRAPADAWIVVDSSGQIIDKQLAAMDAFAIYAGSPLAITLASFDAQAQSDHVRVAWETVSELNNAGFNLYRTSAADQQPAPADLLAFVPSQAPGGTAGAAYSFRDSNVVGGQTYWYWLKDVELNGATALHGPVSVIYAAPTAVTLSAMQVGSAGAPALPVVLVLLALGAAMLLAGIHASRRTQAV
jgi:hypothetical protein